MDNAQAIDAYMRYMDQRGLARATKANRRSQLGKLGRFLGDVSLLAAERDDLRAWADDIGNWLPRTRYVLISSAHSFYLWAQDEGLITDIPTHKLPRPKLPRSVPRPIPEDRLKRAIDVAPDDLRCWLVLAAYAGLRCCEIAPLSRDQVLDTADPPSLLIHGKGGKDRLVPMCERVIEELGVLPSSGYLWARMDGSHGPPTANRVSQLLNRYLREQGISDTAHSLRHRFASQVQRATGDIQTTASLLGHANISNTMIYAELNNERALAAVRALDVPKTAA